MGGQLGVIMEGNEGCLRLCLRDKRKKKGGDHLKERTKVQKWNYFCKTFQDCPLKNKFDFFLSESLNI